LTCVLGASNRVAWSSGWAGIGGQLCLERSIVVCAKQS
jgi:hypothetical protein